ncbi:uncharacterized protein LY89DRAFT_736577 [Mollisia scopiformis]|uniref:Zn(2)-C6 fungal-type domain-containing protein n=1 Tax=Mollisia scopiformis TaxID=149040 RepID=A0A194X2Y6_MOLSC|nr:uncharacterized protein LY89DRAFT_736577 [Mollisia scopiformis]KUJ14546.1 hypothetical protein LY89DRAFT_736577 [Mollisia scopiformis]
MEQVPRLSCERCKRRKIRCDKRNPCSACETSHTTCDFVQRARLPRGRSGKVRKSILEERVARLESLLSQVQNSGDKCSGPPDSTEPVQSRSLRNNRIGNFVAPEFWAALSEEVAGLRETFDNSDDDQVHPDPINRNKTGVFASGHTLLFESAPSCIYGCTPVPWPTISEERRNVLLYLYRQRVDCLYKILHWPTVLADIPCLGTEAQDSCNPSPFRALELSIYFTSLCSITNEEAMNFGLGDKLSLMEQYRVATERALSQAGLLQEPNVTVLQAFVIYLVGHRTFYNSTTWWTLLAVAVRIGTALRLGQEEQQEFDPKELQLRRRLWYCIALLDTHASYDRGTPSMIRWDELGPAPLLLNDDEMSRTTVPLSSSPVFNDMSFLALMFRAMVCQKKITSIPDSAEDGWSARLQLVSSFELSVKQDYFNVGEDAHPFERFTKQVAKGIIASMHLVLRRPPYKQRPGLVPLSDNFNVLEHSTKLLQQELVTKSADFAPWAWKSWVRWNALAIVLVELCSQPPGKSYDMAYAIAIQSFNHYSSLVADTSAGMLWKPITKLMRRLQRLKHSSTISCQASNLSSVRDVNAPGCSSTSNFSTSALDLGLDSQNENNGILQGNQVNATSGDAQFNWFTFTDSINMGYPLDWEHGLY